MEHRIDIAADVPAPLDDVCAMIAEQPGILVTGDREAAAAWPGAVHGAIDVELGGGAAVSHAVRFRLDPLREEGGVRRVAVHWEPVGHEALVPSFHGDYQLWASGRHTALALVGAYTVPLGILGRVGERLGGRKVAEQALGDHLLAVRSRLEAAIVGPHWWQADCGGAVTATVDLTEPTGDAPIAARAARGAGVADAPELYIG